MNNGKIIKPKGDRHRAPVLVSTVPGEFQKPRREGFWGRFICQTCETKFNELDSHAIAVLRDAQPQALSQAWKYDNFEYPKLKLFFISLLWRAAVTEEPFFENVALEARDLSRIKLLIKR